MSAAGSGYWRQLLLSLIIILAITLLSHQISVQTLMYYVTEQWTYYLSLLLFVHHFNHSVHYFTLTVHYLSLFCTLSVRESDKWVSQLKLWCMSVTCDVRQSHQNVTYVRHMSYVTPVRHTRNTPKCDVRMSHLKCDTRLLLSLMLYLELGSLCHKNEIK